MSVRAASPVWVALVALLAACSAPSRDQSQHDRAAGAPDSAPGAVARISTAPPPGTAPDGMVWIPGGTFWMGCEGCGMPDALPSHLVEVDGFWMDRAPVTNTEFARFVNQTGYVTVAERPLDPAQYPGVPRDKLVSGSAVFTPTATPVALDDPLQWWRYTAGANWKHPEGPGSGIANRADHPVVHVAYDDVVAYAKWAGKRLPTEAEFEFAARGGLDRHRYPWGNEMTPGGRAAANTWQGQFPARDRGEDGHLGTSPVTAFPRNGFGLYDMGGNVWQWCADWYRPDTYAERVKINGAGPPVRNPRGPDSSFDPQEPGAAKRVLRGGSYLCTDQYCARYLVGSRGKSEVSSGTSNLGFRLVK
jgi:formylglycine-generating enzyme required for sulfatase activity